MRPLGECGDVAEWSKALAWKVSIRQKRIEGSNPSVSARFSCGIVCRCHLPIDAQTTMRAGETSVRRCCANDQRRSLASSRVR